MEKNKTGKVHASSSNRNTVLINIKTYFLLVLIALQWNVDQVIASVSVINNNNNAYALAIFRRNF